MQKGSKDKNSTNRQIYRSYRRETTLRSPSFSLRPHLSTLFGRPSACICFFLFCPQGNTATIEVACTFFSGGFTCVSLSLPRSIVLGKEVEDECLSLPPCNFSFPCPSFFSHPFFQHSFHCYPLTFFTAAPIVSLRT